MPICFRCGKMLSTAQSLEYHLKKKITCNSLKCNNCNILSDNISEHNIHEVKCNESKQRHNCYDKIHSTKTMIMEIDNNFKILYVSVNVIDLIGYNEHTLIGKNISFLLCSRELNLFKENLIKNTLGSKSNVYLNMKSKGKTSVSFDTDVANHGEYIVLSQTKIYVLSQSHA